MRWRPLFLILGIGLAFVGFSQDSGDDNQPRQPAIGTIAEAEALIGLSFSESERELMRKELREHLEAFAAARELSLGNEVAPALVFDPRPKGFLPPRRQAAPVFQSWVVPEVPENLEELAFWPVGKLAILLRSGRLRSLDLTRMYLKRLKEFGPKLECVVTLAEELALEQARRADEEIAAGRYRGPLHGIPYGAKDLFAVKGYPTTWGAAPYKEQVIDRDAVVIQRLEAAGAVLAVKLTLGALAWGDVWFGGTTRNPWNPEQGSSGSSAGSASASVAGLVGFSLGTETYGSIVSPSTRCGASGLRPTFGRVPRTGAMALSWSMDKIGPICRTVEDCALVFDAIRGPDGEDASVVEASFNYRQIKNLKGKRIGYLKSAFEADSRWQAFDKKALEVLRSLGADLMPIELPEFPLNALTIILTAEAAAAFDALTRSNRDDLLVRQIANAWPNVFRAARFIPAVEYVNANRIRAKLIESMHSLMKDVDLYISPTFGGGNLLLTNLTGHPSVVLPNGFQDSKTPTSITFVGKLYGEADLLAVAKLYQETTGFHRIYPTLE